MTLGFLARFACVNFALNNCYVETDPPYYALHSLYSYFMTVRWLVNVCEQVLHELIEILKQCSFHTFHQLGGRPDIDGTALLNTKWISKMCRRQNSFSGFGAYTLLAHCKTMSQIHRYKSENLNCTFVGKNWRCCQKSKK